MSVSFQSYQAPDVVPVNSLFDLGSAQHQVLANQQQDLQNQTTQNALNDQQTVRDNAVGVAQGDPTATATSLAADPIRAQGIISGLQTQDVATRARVAWGLGQAGQAAQSILDLPANQQQGAWTSLRNQAIANGDNPNVLPEQVPDEGSLIAFRKNSIPSASLLNHQELRQTNSPYDPLDSPPTVPVPGGSTQPPGAGGTGPQAANGGPTPAGSYSNALALRESNPGGKAPNYQATNSAGYLGAYQFGAARLNDLGVYTPAQSENVENNAYNGTFNIPGFPQVKTAADFLSNPAAQNAVQTMSVHDIHNAILNTPGAQNYSEASLQAAAHIGGTAGMRRYVMTAGTAHPYDPADSNGTHISDYVRQFAGLGTISQPAVPPGSAGTPQQGPAGQPAPQVANSNQQPTPAQSAPGGTPAIYANTGTTPPPGMPAVASSSPTAALGTAPAAPGFRNLLADLNSGQPGGSMASAPGTQTASLTGTTGLPQTATDASSASSGMPTRDGGAAGPALAQAQASPPASLPISAGAPPNSVRPPGQNQLAGLGGGGAASGPSTPNQLLNVGSPQQAPPAGTAAGGSGAPAAQQNPLANLSPPTPASQPGTTGPGGFQLPPGTHMMYDGRTGKPDGLVYDGSNLPYVAPDHKVENGNDIISNPYTHQVTGVNPLFNTQRTTTAPDGNGGTDLIQSGKVVGNIPGQGRDVQLAQFKTDQGDLQEASDNMETLQANQERLLDARNLAANLPTGSNAAARQAASTFVHTYFPGSADQFDTAMGKAGMSAVPASELAKLLLQDSGSSEKDALGGRGSYSAIQLFRQANPSLELLPQANRDILNLKLVANQANQDYLRGFQSFVNNSAGQFSKGGRYTPASQYDQQWQSQRNPQVYLAATNAMNGKPFGEWSKGLTPPEIQRVPGIVAGVDRTATINGPQGPSAPQAAATTLDPQNEQASYEALPSGAVFQGSDGVVRTKP